MAIREHDNNETAKSSYLDKLTDTLSQQPRVQLMDRHGSIVTLPYDSHSPLARFITTENVSHLKRYSVDQVFDKHVKVVKGFPPTSNLELAFDIVTPFASSKEDAQVMTTLSNVFYDCGLPVILQISHHSLLEAILVHCQVPEEERSKACHELTTKYEYIYQSADYLVKNFVTTFSCPSMENLLKFVEVSGKISDVKSYLMGLPGWGSESVLLANQAFKNLKKIIAFLTKHNNKMGRHIPIVISVITAMENYDTHSGLVFRFICQSTASL